MSGPKNNQNALAREEPAESFLQCRVPAGSKAQWVRAAQARARRDKGVKPGLTQWVIDALDAAAERELKA
jgi:hypothetical protein